MTNRRPIRRAATGFTLVEAIIVMVITGIIGSMVAVFMKNASDSYFNTVRRAELTDIADVSLRQLAREVRLALPNSLRVTCTAAACYIEFILTSSGGRYRDEGDGSTGGNVLSFSRSSAKTFDVLGPAAGLSLSAGDSIVVFNLGPGYAPADAYAGGNRAGVSAIAGNTVTLGANPFALQSPPLPSPNARFQVVPSGGGPISYVCPVATRGSAVRYSGYGYSGAQPTAFGAGVTSITLLTNITCTVDYTPNVLQRNGLLYVAFTVSDPADPTETVTAFQQIHVDNTP